MEKTLTDERILYSICTNDELMDLFFKDIARKLREERCHQNMDIATLSALSKVSESVIYRYEKGTNKINLSALIKVSSALNLDVSKVISINTSPKEETIGEKFSYMVRNQSKEAVDCILDTIEKMVDFWEIKKG